jgi:hypothetical protein
MKDPGSQVHPNSVGQTCRLLVFFLLFILFAYRPECLGAESVPFKPGEKLHFVLRWSSIPVGRATLAVEEKILIDNQTAYHFSFTARTNAFADLIYTVRDRVDAYTNEEVTHSLLYLQKQREGSRKRDFRVRLYPRRLQAELTRPGRKKRVIPILPGTFDPLSVFYAFRLRRDLKENMVLSAPVTDGKRCVVSTATVKHADPIKVGAREYKLFLVEPDLKDVGGVFKKSENAAIHIWLTADHRRIPVRVESEVVVGRFSAELTAVENIQ